jgi:hypothetical protein
MCEIFYEEILSKEDKKIMSEYIAHDIIVSMLLRQSNFVTGYLKNVWLLLTATTAD